MTEKLICLGYSWVFFSCHFKKKDHLVSVIFFFVSADILWESQKQKLPENQ